MIYHHYRGEWRVLPHHPTDPGGRPGQSHWRGGGGGTLSISITAGCCVNFTRIWIKMKWNERVSLSAGWPLATGYWLALSDCQLLTRSWLQSSSDLRQSNILSQWLQWSSSPSYWYFSASPASRIKIRTLQCLSPRSKRKTPVSTPTKPFSQIWASSRRRSLW